MQEKIGKPRIVTARKLARSLLKECCIKNPPVLLRVVIAHLKKERSLDLYSVSTFSDKLSGMLVTVESDYLDDRHDEIHFNRNHSWKRQRFTIAHEIGHMLMNTSCSSVGTSLNESRDSEIEANQFAAELLMPSEILKESLKRGYKVDELAHEYMVSSEAIGWKISGSNLLRYVNP